MLMSEYFTVMLAELAGSAAETALKLEASAPKIAVAIRLRRAVEGVEVFIVVSRLGCLAPLNTLCAPKRRCMKLGPRLVNVGEDW